MMRAEMMETEYDDFGIMHKNNLEEDQKIERK